MQTTTKDRKEAPLTDLISELQEQSKQLIRDELRLARTEMTETMQQLKRDAVFLASGAALAGASGLALLVGCGYLIGFVFAAAGLSEPLAYALGFGLMAIVLGTAGFVLIQIGRRRLADESLMPRKTLRTLQSVPEGITPRRRLPLSEEEVESRSDAMQLEVNRTQRKLSETMQEVQSRLRPGYLFDVVIPREMQRHPVRLAIIGVGTLWFVKRQIRRSLRALFGRS